MILITGASGTAGRAVVDDLAAAGVDAAVTIDPDAPTATVVVLVGPGGERTMLSDRGAAARLTTADLPALDGVEPLADESARAAVAHDAHALERVEVVRR